MAAKKKTGKKQTDPNAPNTPPLNEGVAPGDNAGGSGDDPKPDEQTEEEKRAAHAAKVEEERLAAEAEEKRIKEEAEAAELAERQRIKDEADAKKAKARKQNNPNTPLSEADKHKQLKELDSELDGSAFRDELPDDIDALKDQLVAMNNQAGDANQEIAELRHVQRQNQHKVDGFDKLRGHLGNEIKVTESKLRPLIGFHDGDNKTEVMAAPIGNESLGRTFVLLLVYYDGVPVNVHISTQTLQLGDNGDGRWLLRS